MCGIAGFIGTALPDDGAVAATLSIMRQRGPDAAGRHVGRLGDHTVLLLHSRLAIIDLDPRADQPFLDGATSLVFNGEIYNYVEVADTLRTRGHRFRTDSDTEVISRAWLEWGEGLVDHLEGMWAFALLDEARQRLVLSRDPFGEKPLYLLRRPEGLYFGSEVKFINALSGYSPPVDLEKLRTYIAHGYRAVFKTPGMFLEGVEVMPAASIRVLSGPDIPPPRRYWSPRPDPTPMSWNEALDGVRDRLFRAIDIRLRADVPLAVTLSGGIDSNVIAGIASKHYGQPLDSFSMLESNADYDERSFIRTAVEALGTRHHERPVESTGFLERLERMTRHYEAPVLTVGMYLEGYLAELVADAQFKLSLNGNGADEIFTGYYDHYLYWLAGLHGTPRFEKEVAIWRETMGRHVQNPLYKDPERFVKTPDERRHLHLNALDAPDFMLQPVAACFQEASFSDEVLRNRMMNELTAESVPVTLFCGDLNWMYHSIENRTAFLDRPLVNFMMRVPSEHLIGEGMSKYLLRSAARGYVPDEILLAKRKFGFNAPVTSLLDRSDPAVQDFMMTKTPLYDLVDRDRVATLMRPETPIGDRSNFLFCLAAAQMFCLVRDA